MIIMSINNLIKLSSDLYKKKYALLSQMESIRYERFNVLVLLRDINWVIHNLVTFNYYNASEKIITGELIHINAEIDELEKIIINDYLHLDIFVTKLHEKIQYIDSLRLLVNLNMLNLQCNEISNLQPLEKLSNLMVLHLYDNHITCIEPLKNLKNLQVLNISKNQISNENIKYLKNLVNLKNLHVKNNLITNVEPLNHLIINSLIIDINLHEKIKDRLYEKYRIYDEITIRE